VRRAPYSKTLPDVRQKTTSLFWNDDDLIEAIALAMDRNKESNNKAPINAADVVAPAPVITWGSGSRCGNAPYVVSHSECSSAHLIVYNSINIDFWHIGEERRIYQYQ
jgi:hypothetical protein